MRFYLGIHHPSHLQKSNVPLFVSFRSLNGRKSLPEAQTRWALDSGGFTELAKHGRWVLSPRSYAEGVKRIIECCGKLDWAAIQDWMCEPAIRRKTSMSVAEHQRATVESWLTLNEIAPDVPWAPVLQGWTWGDYEECIEMYDRTGTPWRERVVGLGSVCRRQDTVRASALIQVLSVVEKLQIHAFGFKKRGLESRFYTARIPWPGASMHGRTVHVPSAKDDTLLVQTASTSHSSGVKNCWKDWKGRAIIALLGREQVLWETSSLNMLLDPRLELWIPALFEEDDIPWLHPPM